MKFIEEQRILAEKDIQKKNTGNNATDRSNISDSRINTQGITGNRNRQALISNPTIDTSNKSFKGAEPNIGCVLGLRFEKVDKKIAYNIFCNKSSK